MKRTLTAASLFGAARGDMIGKLFSNFINREDQDAYYLHKLRLFEKEEQQHYEIRMKGKDGALFWADINASVSRDTNGLRVCRITLSDISKRKAVERTLRLSEEKLAADLKAMTSIQRISTTFAKNGDYNVMLRNILAAAICIARSQKGTLQLFNPKTDSPRNHRRLWI